MVRDSKSGLGGQEERNRLEEKQEARGKGTGGEREMEKRTWSAGERDKERGRDGQEENELFIGELTQQTSVDERRKNGLQERLRIFNAHVIVVSEQVDESVEQRCLGGGGGGGGGHGGHIDAAVIASGPYDMKWKVNARLTSLTYITTLCEKSIAKYWPQIFQANEKPQEKN